MTNSNTASSNQISLSADIVAAYISRNSVTPVGLTALIEFGSWGSLETWCCGSYSQN